jgi:hypothetical protein
MSCWGELKSRKVVKVGVAYTIVTWLLIQGAATIFLLYDSAGAKG